MKDQKINLMISSRIMDQIVVDDGTITFKELRKEVLESFQEKNFLGHNIFDVNISEEFITPADQASWDKCLQEIRDNDIVLVFFTGHEGNKIEGQNVGICRAEYKEALDSNPSKVFIIDFRKLSLKDSNGNEITDETKYESDFAAEVAGHDTWLNFIDVDTTETREKLIEEVKSVCLKIVRSGIVSFVLEGSKSLRRMKHTFGEGLEWSKYNYWMRKKAMEYYLSEGINGYVEVPEFSFLKKSFFAHAVPDGMSVAEARELVGRPFLDDSKYLDAKNGDSKPVIQNGPIHFIAVYKNVTENQIRSIIGHQDVAIIQEDYGFYVWDLINHIQLVYFIKCWDSVNIKMRVDDFFRWMRTSGEAHYLKTRAERRFIIVKTINEQTVQFKEFLKYKEGP